MFRRTGFPGLIAPASLKPLSFPIPDLRLPRFPGLIAPASLKLVVLPNQKIHDLRFSGVNCPGLIEARFFRRRKGGGVCVFRG